MAIAVAVAVLPSGGGLALAATINGTEGDDVLRGTEGPDDIYGR
jgi:hypothetical protein